MFSHLEMKLQKVKQRAEFENNREVLKSISHQTFDVGDFQNATPCRILLYIRQFCISFVWNVRSNAFNGIIMFSEV